jgi:hypothetical protein
LIDPVSHRCQDEKAIAIALNIEDAINQAPLAPLVSTSQAEFGQRKKRILSIKSTRVIWALNTY